jgi:ABC-type polar amino acid transport system ATPase subunit
VSGALVVRALHVTRGDRRVLRGVDLAVAPGEICALMGVSGAGKSTVLRAIAALEPFSAGSIVVDDFILHPGPLRPESQLRGLRSKVGMVFQAHSLFEHLTALENVTLAPMHALGSSREHAERTALELLTALGVSARAGAYPRSLSGGEAQRVTIARALAPNPMVLLMDEPTSALDPARRSALGETLRKLAGQGRGLLIATHDVELAEAYADRVAILSDGAVVEHGPANGVLTAPAHPATRELLCHPGAEPAGDLARERRAGIQGRALSR